MVCNIFMRQPFNDRRCEGKYLFLIWSTYITDQNVVDIGAYLIN